MSVLIATAIGPRKEYSLEFLPKVIYGLYNKSNTVTYIDDLNITHDKLKYIKEVSDVKGLPDYNGDMTTIWGRCARWRELSRQYFLGGNWEWLYFHDDDMIPPKEIISNLLKLNYPLCSGIYLRRGVTEPLAPIYDSDGIVAMQIPGLMKAEDNFLADGCGMGCTLIHRSLLEKTSFRNQEYWDHLFDDNNPTRVRLGEDYQWCVDSQHKVLIDVTQSCWHANIDMTANGLVLGKMTDGGVIWLGSSAVGNNRLVGKVVRGVPRFDIPEDIVPQLGPEFTCSRLRYVIAQTKKINEVIGDYS